MIRRLALAALLLCGAGCDDSPVAPSAVTTTTTTTTTTAAVYVNFQGPLSPLGSSFYSFTASQDGNAVVQLSALNLVGRRDALALAMRVSIGTPKGLGCEPQESSDLSPALVAQFTVRVAAGIHCVSIQDTGMLPADAAFVIRFRYP